MPVIRLKTVVFPAPFGPIRLTISPSPTCRSRSVSTCRPPNESLQSRRRGALEQLRRRSHDLHARRAEQALRPHAHQATSSEPKRIQRAHGRLLDEDVLPDERRQVDGRDEATVRTQPRSRVRSGSPRRARHTTTSPKRGCPGGSAPSSRPVGEPPAFETAPPSTKARRLHDDRRHATPRATTAAEHGGEPAPRPQPDHQEEDDHAVEQDAERCPAGSPRRGTEGHVDHDRAEDRRR